MSRQQSFTDAMRAEARAYRAAFPRALERGSIFAAGVTFALQTSSPMRWPVVVVAFLLFAVSATILALAFGLRVRFAPFKRPSSSPNTETP